jgi:hypothetical protein
MMKTTRDYRRMVAIQPWQQCHNDKQTNDVPTMRPPLQRRHRRWLHEVITRQIPRRKPASQLMSNNKMITGGDQLMDTQKDTNEPTDVLKMNTTTTKDDPYSNAIQPLCLVSSLGPRLSTEKEHHKTWQNTTEKSRTIINNITLVTDITLTLAQPENYYTLYM